MNSYDLDSLRLFAREQHEERLREAEAERLARGIRGTGRRRRPLRVPVELVLGARQRLRPRRLEI